MAETEFPEPAIPAPERDLSSEEAQKSNQDPKQKDEKPKVKDDNSPQQWSIWHKLSTYITICLFSFMANVNASNFTVATLALRKYFGIDATHAVYLTALNVLMFGMGNLLWIPMMRVTGKRPVFLLAMLVLIFSNVWSTKAESYGSLLASRMVSGIGAAAADATVPSVVAELYTVRWRGGMMMCFHTALASGIFVGPLINAYIVEEHGWRWSPAWIAIATSFVFILGFFFIHETQYHRPKGTPPGPARSFLSHLSLTHGFARRPPPYHQTAFQALKNIFIMSTYPPIFFASCLVGIFVGWTIIIQVSVAQTFLAPPYKWTLSQIGVFHLAGWTGALIALYFGGILIDQMAKWNNPENLAQPERRLMTLCIPFTIAPTGLIIYGIYLTKREGWIIPAVGYAMHSFGFVAVSNIVVTYAVESYKAVAGEAMVILFVVRNVIAVICSVYCFPWIQRDGLKVVFGTMAGLEWVFMLFGLLMYFFAGRIRKFTGEYGPRKGKGDAVEGVAEVDDEGNVRVNGKRVDMEADGVERGPDGTVE